MSLSTLFLAILYFVASTEAIEKTQICFDSVFESLAYVVFAGDDPDVYYASACQYPPKVLSIYASAKTYCTQDEIQSGIKLLREYCWEYGPDLKLLPYEDFTANLTDASLKRCPVVDYATALSAETPYTKPILISKDFFEAMHKTVVAWEFEMWTHHTYGFVLERP